MKDLVVTVLSFALAFTRLDAGPAPAVAGPAPNDTNTQKGLLEVAILLVARQMAPDALADRLERTLPAIHKLLRPPIV